MITSFTPLLKLFAVSFLCLFFCAGRLSAQTFLSGNVQGTLTKAKSPYSVFSAVVPAGQTLTIEPGVEIFFNPSNSVFRIDGTLIAEGTATDSIRFTSRPPSSRSPTDRYGPVQVTASSQNSSFAYVKFKELGYQTINDTLVSFIISSPTCSVKNSNFENILGTAILAEVPGIRLSNNKFSALSLDVLVRVDNLSVINGNTGLKVGLLTGITKNATIQAGNFYKVLNNLTVPAGIAFTVEPGIGMQFTSDNSQITVQGTFKAEGTAADSITFAGQGGFSSSIIFAPESIDNSLRYVQLIGMGSGSFDTTAALQVRSASTSIQRCNFISMPGPGIYIAGVLPPVTDNDFSGNNLDVVASAEFLTSLSGNVPLKIGLLGMNDNAVLLRQNALYRLLRNTTIPAGKTLGVEPGSTVEFLASRSQLTIQGRLMAQGTPTDSIRFYSFPRFTQSSPSTSGGPIVGSAAIAGNLMQWISVDGLGFSTPSDGVAVVQITSPGFVVQNCSFRNIRGSAVSLRVSNPPLNDFAPQITDNDFSTTNLGAVLPVERLYKVARNTGQRTGIYNDANLTTDVRLTKEHMYQAISTLLVRQGYTMTLDPGVDITFPVNTGSVSLQVQGTLIAEGTASDSIRLHGVPLPYGFQLAPITLTTTSTNNSFRYVLIDGFGFTTTGNDMGVILNLGSSFTLQHCSITHVNGTALWLQARPTAPVSNNIFQTNVMDVITNPDYLRDIVDNGPLKIGLYSANPTILDDTLYASRHQFYRVISSLQIAQNRTFTIEPGVTVQFRPEAGGLPLVIRGTLIAKGTSASRIQFVAGPARDSFNDVLGTAGPLRLEATSVNTILQYVTFDRLGNRQSGSGVTPSPVVFIGTPSFTFDHVILQNSYSTGLSLQNTGTATVSSSCFLNNSGGGVLTSSGTPQFVNCNFVNNYAYALNNTSTADIVHAENCWWGDASGPNHYITNPTATGGIVSNNVVYAPWSSAAFDCNSSSGSLPLTLTDFSVASQSGTVRCSWQTASEFNTSFFIIEHSVDGNGFTDLGRVNAAGQSSALLQYKFLDPMPAGGINYYRLKMVDKDGSFTYSKVLTINLSTTASVAIFPNPVKENLNVQIRNQSGGQVTIQLLNIHGMLLQQRTQELQAGTTTVSFHMSGLAKGVYVLYIKGEKSEWKTFVIE